MASRSPYPPSPSAAYLNSVGAHLQYSPQHQRLHIHPQFSPQQQHPTGGNLPPARPFPCYGAPSMPSYTAATTVSRLQLHQFQARSMPFASPQASDASARVRRDAPLPAIVTPRGAGDVTGAHTSFGAPKYISNPGPRDVLLGRGSGANTHEGNRAFRRFVETRKMEYKAADKYSRPRIAREVVEYWRNNNGRFLARVDESRKGPGSIRSADVLWYEVDDKKALERAGQALRERNTSSLTEDLVDADTFACEAKTSHEETNSSEQQRVPAKESSAPSPDETGREPKEQQPESQVGENQPKDSPSKKEEATVKQDVAAGKETPSGPDNNSVSHPHDNNVEDKQSNDVQGEKAPQCQEAENTDSPSLASYSKFPTSKTLDAPNASEGQVSLIPTEIIVSKKTGNGKKFMQSIASTPRRVSMPSTPFAEKFGASTPAVSNCSSQGGNSSIAAKGHVNLISPLSLKRPLNERSSAMSMSSSCSSTFAIDSKSESADSAPSSRKRLKQRTSFSSLVPFIDIGMDTYGFNDGDECKRLERKDSHIDSFFAPVASKFRASTTDNAPITSLLDVDGEYERRLAAMQRQLELQRQQLERMEEQRLLWKKRKSKRRRSSMEQGKKSGARNAKPALETYEPLTTCADLSLEEYHVQLQNFVRCFDISDDNENEAEIAEVSESNSDEDDLDLSPLPLSFEDMLSSMGELGQKKNDNGKSIVVENLNDIFSDIDSVGMLHQPQINSGSSTFSVASAFLTSNDIEFACDEMDA